MNAANEVAVNAFIDGRIRLTDIPHIIERVMNRHPVRPVDSLDVVLDTDETARIAALTEIDALIEVSPVNIGDFSYIGR